MMRGWSTLRSAFPNSADEYAQPLLERRRAEMDEAWAKLDEAYAANKKRMEEVELRPRTDEEGVIRLNVGGANVTLCWHLLAEAEGFKESILGALLEGVWGDGRIPRDADGRIVLDESPTCIKHAIVQTTLKANGRSSSVAVAADEVPCLVYTSHVMGLPRSMLTRHPNHVNISGRSTVMEPFEIAPLGAKIREWVGLSAEQMTLIYRATRDGFDTTPTKTRRNKDSPNTIHLVRVKSGKNNNDDDSIVGGYYSMPLGSPVKNAQCNTEATFLFMLKDGSATRKDPSKPVKWTPRANAAGRASTGNKDDGPGASGSDLETTLDATSGCCTLETGREWFDIEDNSPFLALNGNKVVDIEVYRYWTPALLKTTAPSTAEPVGVALADAESYDIRSFGESIASSLMEERAVLDRAAKETEAAGARVSAAVGALETVYGPSVAAGEQDPVVELNVRGTRMTTLRSTLQACPRSALAAVFNDDRWPNTDKDKDEHGRLLVDCKPSCFSKILDVLRMRKRSSWGRSVAHRKQEEGREEKDKGEKEEEEEEEEKEEEKEKKDDEDEAGKGEDLSSKGGSGAVLIKKGDVKAFGAAVNKYFPGCERFIMDLVQSV